MGGIIICFYCGMYECPPPCPNFDGTSSGLGKKIGFCAGCEAYIYEDDGHVKYENKLLCAKCAEELVPDGLLDFLECRDANEFFKLLR
ncbi:MAG: hypothetical protein ACI3XL_06250 [Eubacteriales bacterium]